ncbi:ParB-like protein [Paraburkholderia sp. BR10937]|uniref:ParB-like protein n=1 Tax=Paraburkholderia sp. BR10937 TaxID=3236994 RepID=UPI0034D358D8
MKTDLRNLPLSCMRPTQITVGIRYVRVKEVISERNRARLAQFQLRHPVQVVLGPDDACYIVDHHHWAMAWHFMGVTSAPALVVADHHLLEAEDFWALMREHRRVHPFGPSGVREPLGALPQSLGEMLDDPLTEPRCACATRRRLCENSQR